MFLFQRLLGRSGVVPGSEVGRVPTISSVCFPEVEVCDAARRQRKLPRCILSLAALGSVNVRTAIEPLVHNDRVRMNLADSNGEDLSGCIPSNTAIRKISPSRRSSTL